nr:response regulator [Desulfobulbaceae bacterium]
MLDESMKILIVDDDAGHLSLIERYAESMGLQYISAENGEEAVKLLTAGDFSVVVTDLVMPKMDGMGLLKHIKENYATIDVIVMTGFSSQYSYIDVIKAGAADFIAKPFKRDEFVAKLDRVFRERDLLKELREAKEKAESGSNAKTNFLCTIGHELRTPMNGIMGFAGLLAGADLPPEPKKYVGIVEKSAERLMKLLNQILDFSAIEAGKTDRKPCHFQLKPILDNLLTTATTRSQEKKLSLNLDVDEQVSEELLFGDKVALEQILYNITDNAIKFTDSGSIEIKVRKVRELSDGRSEFQFSVKDTGCGLEVDKHDHIFEPFTQAEDYMTRRHEGVGLGLATCAKFVSMLDGKIWVESRVDKGSTFYFTVAMGSA